MSVGGLSPIGCLPIQITSKLTRGISRRCINSENKDAVLYNEKLQKLLPTIEASLPGSKILYANVYDPMMDMIKHPAKYGMFTLLLPQVIITLVYILTAWIFIHV